MKINCPNCDSKNVIVRYAKHICKDCSFTFGESLLKIIEKLKKENKNNV